jgi:hypothetical protein
VKINTEPDSGLLCIHYGRNRLFGADGCAHVVRAESKKKHDYPTHYITENQARQIDICLHCTKEKCRGGGDCFPVHRKKEKKEVTQND